MKGKRYVEEQVIGILKEHEANVQALHDWLRKPSVRRTATPNETTRQ